MIEEAKSAMQVIEEMKIVVHPDPQSALRNPPDLDEAFRIWGATCGPAALAAALRLSLADVRAAVSDPESIFKGYMGAIDMRDALIKLKAHFSLVLKDERVRHREMMGPSSHTIAMRPATEILLLQWDGPWRNVPRAAATHRHWIVYIHGYVGTIGPGWIYDGNTGWVPYTQWEREIQPQLIPKRGTGEWSIAWGAVVST